MDRWMDAPVVAEDFVQKHDKALGGECDFEDLTQGVW